MRYKSVDERAEKIRGRVKLTDFLVVIQLFLRDNFFLERKLEFSDVKPRLLGHWGSCHGINLVYNVFSETLGGYSGEKSFILGPGHGFPALNANLFLDKKLPEFPQGATRENIPEFAKRFSWPGGYPSHSSPMTPGVVTEGGELGYALGAAYGQVLGHPERTVVVLLGDGELETATALASMNLAKLIPSGETNGKVIPVLHLNGYKISGPTIYGRKSQREINQLIRGFGYEPIEVNGEDIEEFLEKSGAGIEKKNPFFLMRTEKGEGGPEFVGGKKVVGNYLAHQIPLPLAGSDEGQLGQLEEWLKSYEIDFSKFGFSNTAEEK